MTGGPLYSKLQRTFGIVVWISNCCTLPAEAAAEIKVEPQRANSPWSAGHKKDCHQEGIISFFAPQMFYLKNIFPSQIKPYFCLAFSLIFLTAAVGYLPVLFMISHCVVTYISAMTRSVVSVWCSSLLILLSLQHDDVRFWQVSRSLWPCTQVTFFGLYFAWSQIVQLDKNKVVLFNHGILFITLMSNVNYNTGIKIVKLSWVLAQGFQLIFQRGSEGPVRSWIRIPNDYSTKRTGSSNS